MSYKSPWWKKLGCFTLGIAAGIAIRYFFEGNWGSLQAWQVAVSGVSATVIAWLAYMTHRLSRRQIRMSAEFNSKQIELFDKQDELLHRQDEMDRNPKLQCLDSPRKRARQDGRTMHVHAPSILANPGRTPILVTEVRMSFEGEDLKLQPDPPLPEEDAKAFGCKPVKTPTVIQPGEAVYITVTGEFDMAKLQGKQPDQLDEVKVEIKYAVQDGEKTLARLVPDIKATYTK